MDDLERALPGEIVEKTVRSNNELVFPFEQARTAVEIATEHAIAVLGVEIFRVRQSGLETEGYINHGFQFDGNWASFVGQNNRAAAKYVKEHQFGEGHGYILTTTSEREFNQMREQLK